MERRRRTRDDDEFDELVGAAWPRLHRTALLITGDPERADRLARTSLERTWAQWRRARHDDPLAFAGTLLVGDDLDVFDSVDLTPDHDEAVDVAPDPAVLREQGWRIRDRQRRTVVASCVLSVVAAVAAVVGISSLPEPGGDTGPGYDELTALSAYEQRVLDEVPGAYDADGVVVVPGPIDPASDRNALFSAPVLEGGLVPLGTHLFTSVGDFATTVHYPSFMSGPPPLDSQVDADIGPGSIGCLHRKEGPCQLVLVVSDHRVGTFQVEVLDAVGFLEKDVETQVFVRPVFQRGRPAYLVIGGIGGTPTDNVQLTLADGTTRHAHVDSGRLSPGNTVYWLVVDQDVRTVTAYGDDGGQLETHDVRPCDDPVSCRVR